MKSINIHKIKIFEIMTNGSLNISYKTSNYLNKIFFLEKDHINFVFNLKNKKLNIQKFGSNYKDKIRKLI